MYAIVEIKGKQFKVEEHDKLFVPLMSDVEEDDTVSFDRVLLVGGNGDVRVGTPTVAGATVQATVLGHVKGDKVLVFKKKRRKRYKVTRGHRQRYTHIEIASLTVNGTEEQESEDDA